MSMLALRHKDPAHRRLVEKWKTTLTKAVTREVEMRASSPRIDPKESQAIAEAFGMLLAGQLVELALNPRLSAEDLASALREMVGSALDQRGHPSDAVVTAQVHDYSDRINAAFNLGPSAKADQEEAIKMVTSLLSVAGALLAQNFRAEALGMADGFAGSFRETVIGMLKMLKEGN
jgi:hypothetical protein